MYSNDLTTNMNMVRVLVELSIQMVSCTILTEPQKMEEVLEERVPLSVQSSMDNLTISMTLPSRGNLWKGNLGDLIEIISKDFGGQVTRLQIISL